MRSWITCCFLLVFFDHIHGLRSSFTYHPQGQHPLLYTPGLEPIMHLDQVIITTV